MRDLRCTDHGVIHRTTDCAACGRRADIAEGAILSRLYPGEFFCRGCGRRTLHCTCADLPVEALAKVA